jgi:hypothetical protein
MTNDKTTGKGPTPTPYRPIWKEDAAARVSAISS